MPIRLLLADDSVVIQKLVGLSFANEDIEIITVDNGDDAVTRAVECKPDIVLADVVMPGKNGYEVCACIREHPELSSTPILLLTGTFEAFDGGRAEEVGATGHITKPFEAQALVDRVNELLAERRPAAADTSPGATGSDFFDDNLGDLAGPGASGTLSANADSGGDFAFGSSERDPLSSPLPPPFAETGAETGAETVALAPNTDLDELLGAASGDRTVAILPESMPAPLDEDLMAIAPPLAQTDASLLPTPTSADSSEPLTPENPEQTVLVDDFLDDPGLDDPQPMSASFPLATANPPPATTIGALNLTSAPAAASAQTTEGGATGADALLSGDLFSDGPDLDADLAVALDDPAPPARPASQDVDFSGSDPLAAEAIVPANAEDYNVSASDLEIDHLGEDPGWSARIPADLQGDFGATSGDGSPDLGPGPDASAQRAETQTALTPDMRNRIHDTLEKVAWEAFSDLSDTIVRQLMERVEQIAWEVIPQMAETLIRDEIQHMKAEEFEDDAAVERKDERKDEAKV